jgi:hypothetical protein
MSTTIEPISNDNSKMSFNDNPQMIFIYIITIFLYTNFFTMTLSDEIVNLLSNNIVKMCVFIIVLLVFSQNIAIGILLGIGLLIIFQLVSTINIKNELLHDNFTPLDKQDNIYLSNPLLKQSQLNHSFNNLNLKLENVNDKYENMIKKGKMLLHESMELKNDLKLRHDDREKQIADVSEHNGLTYIQSGNNRLYKSDDGYYKNTKIFDDISYNSDNDNSYEYHNNDNNFIKYDKLVNTYSDNEMINDLLDDINKKYASLKNNSEMNQHDFDNKIDDIYATKYEVIIAIYDIKKESLDNDKKNYIDSLINNIKNKKQNNMNYHEEVNILLPILL